MLFVYLVCISGSATGGLVMVSLTVMNDKVDVKVCWYKKHTHACIYCHIGPLTLTCMNLTRVLSVKQLFFSQTSVYKSEVQCTNKRQIILQLIHFVVFKFEKTFKLTISQILYKQQYRYKSWMPRKISWKIL